MPLLGLVIIDNGLEEAFDDENKGPEGHMLLSWTPFSLAMDLRSPLLMRTETWGDTCAPPGLHCW